jgi:hypothetical protein
MPKPIDPYHKATLADKKLPIIKSSISASKVRPSRVIESSMLAPMVKIERRFEPSPNVDKIYLYVDKQFNPSWIEDFIDEIKSRSLSHAERRKFFSRKNSNVIKIGAEQIVVLCNKFSTEIQYNGKKTSHSFMTFFTDSAFDGDDLRVARIDISFDVHKPIKWVLDHLRISNKRVRKIYLAPTFVPETDSKLGVIYKLAPPSEYHGKLKEIVIYDPFEPHGIGPGYCRIEIRFKKMRVAPVRNFKQLPDLLVRDNLFKDLHLPMMVSLKVLSERQLKHYKKLCRMKSKHNCSMSMALAVLRRTNSSEADSAARAWKKTELDYFNFNEAFRENFQLYLNSKLKSDEADFLSEFIAATGISCSSTPGPKA